MPMRLTRRAWLLLAGLLTAARGWAQAPTKILFVGNSFTYTRPPALQYNAAAVEDMNFANFLANPTGSDPALPQPWGGVAGLFKAFTTQAGLDWSVHHSLRGGATLRGHYLNTNPANWDLRANIAAQRWDVVVLQGNSTEALPRAGGDLLQFKAYVNKLERYVHAGTPEQYRERDLFPGGSGALRTIPENRNANPDALVLLYQTWARPDLIYPSGEGYSGETLERMTADLRDAYAAAATENGRIAAVVPVGEAFLRAVQTGVALRNPYAPDDKHAVDLWWQEDQFHSSKYGSYLSALVMFGALTRVDPSSFGANEQAAADLGIAPLQALRLQRVAADQLAASGYALKRINCLHANPRAGVVCR